MAALIGADGNGVGILLNRRPHHLVDTAIMAEMHHLDTAALNQPAHHIDGGIVTIKQRSGRHNPQRRGLDLRARRVITHCFCHSHLLYKTGYAEPG